VKLGGAVVGTVLGIDPAWTPTGSSGVALLKQVGDRWSSVALAPSYESFLALAEGEPVDWDHEPRGNPPKGGGLLDAAERLGHGRPIRVVTVDIPIARGIFSSRRPADQLVSRKFGGVGCAVHSPTETRPGQLGRDLSDDLLERGFQVCTTTGVDAGFFPLLEVYPHPAVMALLGEPMRFPYKVAKSRTYWKGSTIEFRVGELLKNWSRIIVALSLTIDDIHLPIPKPGGEVRLQHLKKYEDALDALICAWVGTQFLEAKCRPLGNDQAAIWIPEAALVPRSPS
jgi:predicted RNase H-like nuclease